MPAIDHEKTLKLYTIAQNNKLCDVNKQPSRAWPAPTVYFYSVTLIAERAISHSLLRTSAGQCAASEFPPTPQPLERKCLFSKSNVTE